MVGGWRFRWTSGVTRRANSALPVGNEARMEELVAFGEEFYRSRGAPAKFLVSAASAPSGLVDHLQRRGYRAHDRTLVMTIDTAQLLARTAVGQWSIEIASQVTPRWFASYWQADAARPIDSEEAQVFVARRCLYRRAPVRSCSLRRSTTASPLGRSSSLTAGVACSALRRMSHIVGGVLRVRFYIGWRYLPPTPKWRRSTSSCSRTTCRRFSSMYGSVSKWLMSTPTSRVDEVSRKLTKRSGSRTRS